MERSTAVTHVLNLVNFRERTRFPVAGATSNGGDGDWIIGQFFFIVARTTDFSVAAIATAMFISAPGFVELSASCMLEIPSLAAAVGALACLISSPSKFYTRDITAGLAFAVGLLTKLVAAILLPVIAAVVFLHELERAKDKGLPAERRLFRSSAAISARRLTVFAISMCLGFLAFEYFVDRGAFLSRFQQTWRSHFAAGKSFEYGSANDHPFDWLIFLRNWDTTAIALAGLWFCARHLRSKPIYILPIVWLVLEIAVFSAHRPWWPYYYVHIALPLCCLAAIGAVGLWRSLRRSRQLERLVFQVIALSAICWMAARVYFEIRDIRRLPRVHAALVLEDIRRFKPYARYLFTDELIYSFHAGIPMPPNLAVIPLKRLWSGEMTNAGIGSELLRIKPELLLLNNDAQERPFTDLVASDYQPVYEDNRLRLFVRRDVAALANQ